MYVIVKFLSDGAKCNFLSNQTLQRRTSIIHLERVERKFRGQCCGRNKRIFSRGKSSFINIFTQFLSEV